MIQNEAFCLLLLAADADIEAVLRTLLRNAQGAAAPSSRFIRSPRRDAGLLKEAQELARPFLNRAKCVLAVLDYWGSGGSGKSPTQIEQDIEHNFQLNGWQADCCAVVVIQPELETWFWSCLTHRAIAETLDSDQSLVSRVAHRHSVSTGLIARPKEALREVVRQANRRWSSALASDLASRIHWQQCYRPCFCKAAKRAGAVSAHVLPLKAMPT